MDPGEDFQDGARRQDGAALPRGPAGGPADALPRPDRRAGSPGSSRRLVPAPASLVGRTVAEVERDLILDTLCHCHGNRTHAAKILGISIRTLRNKLNEYGRAGIIVPEPGQARVVAA